MGILWINLLKYYESTERYDTGMLIRWSLMLMTEQTRKSSKSYQPINGISYFPYLFKN